MTARLRSLIVPGYLLLCLIAGGSTQNPWASMILRLLAVAILAWAFFAARTVSPTRSERRLNLIVGLGLALIVAQLVPLPPALWTKLPGRVPIAEGLALLDQPLPWLPISLAPYATLSAALALLPPLAVLAAMLRLRAYTPALLSWAGVVAALAGIILGAMQLTTLAPGSLQSPWYLYSVTNLGTAAGFFANSNHMATLLLATLPLLAALLATRQQNDGRRSLGTLIVVAVVGSLVLLGLLLNGSLAGLALAVPVLAASAAIAIKPRRPPRLILLGMIVLVAGGLVVMLVPYGLDHGAAASVKTRQEIFVTSATIARDFAPVGTGLGTYQDIYPSYEDPDLVDRTFINHAHNDYLELAAELGIPGIALIVAFLVWWVATAAKAWRPHVADPFARSATIVSAAILAHSLVDFPLRTAAISTLFAACLALMAKPWVAPAASSARDLRPTRHLTVD